MELLLTATVGVAMAAVAACDEPARASSSANASRPVSPASPVTGAAAADFLPTGGSSLPQGWRRCVNTVAGHSIGYPVGWYTTHIRPAEACIQFHPDRFTIPRDSEYPLTALNARPVTGLPNRTDTAFEQVLLWQEVAVAGRRAVRFETVSTGEGQDPAGTRRYGYVIRLADQLISVHTTAEAGEHRYSAWKTVVDRAAHTLRHR